MSYFGKDNPLQEMLEWVEYVQRRYKLSQEELAVLLTHVLSAVIDPYDNKKDVLKSKTAHS